MLALSLGGADGVRLANFLALGVNALVLSREWRLANLRHAALLVVPAVLITAPTAVLTNHAGSDVLSVAAGVVVLLAVGMLALGVRVERLRGRAGALATGLVSGVMNTIAGVSGPVVATYAANAEWRPRDLRPTLALYFLVLNVAAVLARGVPSFSDAFIGGLAAALVTGFVVGASVRHFVSFRTVQAGILVLAALGGLGAIARGL